jgi:glycosyltransferase involved in cell wall biosynthesis
MTRALVSVVIETINARSGCATGTMLDRVADTLNGLDRQTYPQELIERIVVLDGEVADAEAEELCRCYPSVKFLSSLESNYFAAKNAGAAAASSDIIAMLDSDCLPAPDWLEALIAPLEAGAKVVGGRSRYRGNSWTAWTFSIPHFAYILAEENSEGSGINIHNVAFRREVLLAHPFDTRIRRNGGCYLLFHQLRAEGALILNEPRAVVEHGLDFRGLGFVGKHFERGIEGVTVYRLDDRTALRGTRLFRRFGALALMAITGRRIGVDCLRMLRHRRQIGISAITLPYFGAVAVMTRLIELMGSLTALVAVRSSK